MLYVGIDPGERWVGMAILALRSDGSADTDSRVYDVANHGGYVGMTKDIIGMIPHNAPTMMVVEDFQIRTVGHQTFGRGTTLRMIGALEYAVDKIRQFTWDMVPPGDHLEAIELFGKPLWNTAKGWPTKRRWAEQWHHCLSAWRVLGHHLMHRHPSTLLGLQECVRVRDTTRFVPVIGGRGDLIATPVSWVRPKRSKRPKRATRHKGRP